MAVSVFRVKDYGGEMVKTATGGRGTEFYVVDGCSWEEVSAAYAGGLPTIGSLHTDTRLQYVGPVRSVGPCRSWAPLTWLACVQYSTGGTFLLSTNLGSEETGGQRDLILPILTSGSGGVGPFLERYPHTVIPRFYTRRVEKRSVNSPSETQRALLKRNVGRMYTFTSLWTPSNGIGVFNTRNTYTLVDFNIYNDASNHGRIDTIFESTSQVKAFPVGTFGGQGVAIPALPENCWYDTDVVNGVVNIVNPVTIDNLGETLTWL